MLVEHANDDPCANGAIEVNGYQTLLVQMVLMKWMRIDNQEVVVVVMPFFLLVECMLLLCLPMNFLQGKDLNPFSSRSSCFQARVM